LRGIYTIVMRLEKDTKCTIGALGLSHFGKGVYLYTGSAHGKGNVSIEGRKERHLGKRNRNFWHIDYLLSARSCRIQAFIYSETARDLECKVNRRVQELSHATFPVRGFGSSDCICPAHLLHSTDYQIDQALTVVGNAYRLLGLKPRLCHLR